MFFWKIGVTQDQQHRLSAGRVLCGMLVAREWHAWTSSMGIQTASINSASAWGACQVVRCLGKRMIKLDILTHLYGCFILQSTMTYANKATGNWAKTPATNSANSYAKHWANRSAKNLAAQSAVKWHTFGAKFNHKFSQESAMHSAKKTANDSSKNPANDAA